MSDDELSSDGDPYSDSSDDGTEALALRGRHGGRKTTSCCEAERKGNALATIQDSIGTPFFR